ncbi:MAG: KamA family radical SAM protein [Spirochaetales bacterium]|nr:KamA family radical SAM protein [Spirochaetales bacterium]
MNTQTAPYTEKKTTSMASREKINMLLDSNPNILRLLVSSNNLQEARSNMFAYLNQCEQEVLQAHCMLHPLEKKNTRDCINVFKNIISESNEQKTDHSCLNTLWRLAIEHWRQQDWPGISDAFLVEMRYLFKGIIGLSEIYSRSGICKREVPAFVHMKGKEAAIVRSNLLNEKAYQYTAFINKNDYRNGLHPQVISSREENKKAILACTGGIEKDWNDFRWQVKNAFKDTENIKKIIELTDTEESCIKDALENNIPFTITPYYLSLMDKKQDAFKHDRALRLHVIPNRIFLEKMTKQGIYHKEELDFMHELDTSPEDFITRRYSMIAIIKPYSWCPQLCIYCQRNWELLNSNAIKGIIPRTNLKKAFEWFKSNPDVREVLITGGDPLALSNEKIDHLLQEFVAMDHIRRIRIGTRTLVTMPMRFNEELLEVFKKYHNTPYKSITLVTHIQHAYEITPEMADVVRKLKSIGIDIYNQQVFSMQNCRKFETCFLRESLKEIGIIPYYLFNLKGKDETADFKVPIARLLQEQKEEARLLPGLIRTDKPVFNVPTLGKNELNSWQDHDVIMILDDGSRIYEFYPWEKYMAPVNTYLYRDMPIYDFLQKLQEYGENPQDYRTIWYYF